MPLNSAMVYRRTDRGLREVYEKSHQFTQSERLVLILLDGRLTVASLRARLPSLEDDRIERTIVKLEEAGLVERATPEEAVPPASPAEEVMRLEPDIVAEFLEQNDLDPITASSIVRETAAGELVRAGAERAAALVAEGGKAETVRFTAMPAADIPESGRSHFTGAFDDQEWASTEATRFAITTVNVPDRLELQEELDRAETEEYGERRRQVGMQAWMRRLLVVTVIVVFGGVAYGVLNPLWDDASARRVGERLSASFKRPVTVRDTEFKFLPSPRLVLHSVDIGGEFGAEQVALLISWKDLWFALNGGQWAWGEAAVGPLEMSGPQAIAMVRTLPAAVPQLPGSIAAVRLEAVAVTGSKLFPGVYVATMRRGADGRFGPLVLKPKGGADATMQVQFQASGEPEVVDFSLEARRWTAPIGPRTEWNFGRAAGRISQGHLEASYTLDGYFGITSGTVSVRGGGEWLVSGTAQAANIDVETVLKSSRAPGAAASDGPAAMQGTAALNLAISGRGATPEEAIARSVLAGPFTVRFAVLNGINLGLAATQGVAASGSTRFTEFGGLVAATEGVVRFEETGGRAGAMVARGQFNVAPDASLAGALRVELGGQRVQAPMTLRISGTVAQPKFGR